MLIEFPPTKTCSRCLVEKPRTPDLWYFAALVSGQRSAQSPCRDCRRVEERDNKMKAKAKARLITALTHEQQFLARARMALTALAAPGRARTK